MKNIDLVAAVLLVVAGLNWGMIAFFNYDMVGQLCGHENMMSRAVYGAVGLCALYETLNWAKAKFGAKSS